MVVMNNEQRLLDSRELDGKYAELWQDNGRFDLIVRDASSQKIVYENSVSYIDGLNFLGYSSTGEHRTVGRTLLDLLPVGIMLGGLGAWDYFANHDNAGTGLILFGVSVLCGYGEHLLTKKFNEKTEDFNNDLSIYGLNQLTTRR